MSPDQITDNNVYSAHLELPPRAVKFIEVARAVDQMTALAEENPDSSETYAEAIAKGQLMMAMLEPDAAIAFSSVLLHTEPAEVLSRRRLIESIRDEPDFNDFFTESDIQQQLSALPTFPDYDPEVKVFVTKYFERIGEFLIALSGSERDHTTTGNSPETAKEKPKLTITIFKDRVIQIGEDGELVSLMRVKEIPATSKEEIMIAEDRVRALKLIAAFDPEGNHKGLVGADIQDHYSENNRNSHYHSSNVVEFLEGLTFEDKPILEIYKPTQDSRRRYHKNGAYNITFIESNERSGLVNEEIFELPGDEFLFNKSAILAYLLLRADKDHPVTTDDFLKSGYYDEDELAKLSDGPNLSSAVAYLRRKLDQLGLLDQAYSIRSSTSDDRAKSYWLTYHGEDINELYPFLGNSVAETQNANELTESEEQRRESIAQFTQLANWLVKNKKILEAYGINTCDEHIAADLESLIDSPSAQDMQTIRAVIQLSKEISSDNGLMEKLFELDKEDPRWPIIDYLFATQDGEYVFTKLINNVPELDKRVVDKWFEAYAGIHDWRTNTDAKTKQHAEDIFALLDRVGNHIQIVTGSVHTDFNAIKKFFIDLHTVESKLKPNQDFMRILDETFTEWLRTPNDGSTRGKRRSWATIFKHHLKQAR